jgi:serine/threonine protein phosphatase PrpC
VACSLGSVGTDGHCWHCGHAQPRPRDHQEAELESVAAVSDRGLRHHRNEDAFSVSTTWLPDGTPAVVAVVCDGVSSAHRPDDASAAAVEMVNESLLDALEHAAAPEEAMRKALASGAQAVTDLASEDHQGADPFPRHSSPACTCVSAVMTGGVLTIGWVGDSRAYWIPDDRSRPSARLTEDDSWAARMVAAGIMSEQEAYSDVRAHAITGWLGADAVELNPHTATFEPDEPGVVVVCTDGLWNYAESSPELASVVPSDARHRPLQAARALVGVALDGGGHDNITVAVLPFPATISTATAAGAPVGRARSQP